MQCIRCVPYDKIHAYKSKPRGSKLPETRIIQLQNLEISLLGTRVAKVETMAKPFQSNFEKLIDRTSSSGRFMCSKHTKADYIATDYDGFRQDHTKHKQHAVDPQRVPSRLDVVASHKASPAIMWGDALHAKSSTNLMAFSRFASSEMQPQATASARQQALLDEGARVHTALRQPLLTPRSVLNEDSMKRNLMQANRFMQPTPIPSSIRLLARSDCLCSRLNSNQGKNSQQIAITFGQGIPRGIKRRGAAGFFRRRLPNFSEFNSGPPHRGQGSNFLRLKMNMELLVHARAMDRDMDSFNLDPRLIQHLVAGPVTKPDVPPQYQEVDDYAPDVMTLSTGDSSYREHDDDDHENDHPSLYFCSMTFKPVFTQPHWTTQLGSSPEPLQSNPSMGNARKRRLRAKAKPTATYEESDGMAKGNVPKTKRNRSSHQVDCNLMRAKAKCQERIISQGVEVLRSSE
ncbi:hypothetical protein EV421DRAFT_1743087 [Armillaria borealis]|uniref:Uncharacterized protein n=1 Tax=Armillaria borealis TaxID=47425 RepID=A0AA39IVY7_9AGAR|nr:hypothetical protein EV421DRAFT_1743087 [Armillaria borealis]